MAAARAQSPPQPRARVRTIASGAGFAGDRLEPAVALAASGLADDVVLECLAERTIVAGLHDRARDEALGYDRRLQRRLGRLLPVAAARGCRIVSNLGSANPQAAADAIARLAARSGCDGLRVAAVVGDDVSARAARVGWSRQVAGELLGAHAYLGCEPIAEALAAGADVVVTGRVADAALFAACVAGQLDDDPDALAGALAVGHLLECAGQLTGGNFEPPGGGGLDAESLAALGYPLASVEPDGTAELFVLDGFPARLDRITCTLQLLYEVHDPAAYVTPDAVVDFTAVAFEEVAPNRVRVSGARHVGRPERLKVSGFVERPGTIVDAELGFAGAGAEDRASRAAEVLRLRLSGFGEDELLVELESVRSLSRHHGGRSLPTAAQVRVRVSAVCGDVSVADDVEDEVVALTLSGPGAGGSLRSGRRPRVEAVDGLVDRALVSPSVCWGRA